MAKFDRYMLSQCLQFFGFFSLLLVLVYWVNQAVVLFDRLIADGQSALVFLEFSALALPNLIRLVLPVSAFAAVLYVTNRMSSENELTVMQATGYSARRMAWPVAIFGVIASIMMAILMNYLVPVSHERLSIRQSEVRENVTGRLLREGIFTHPGSTSTLYLRDITQNGELLDVFLADAGTGNRDQIFTAERAFLVRTEQGPRLVMIDGQSQTLYHDTQTLFVTTFRDFVLDIEALLDPGNDRRPDLRELGTLELLFPTDEALDRTRKDLNEFAQEAHERLSQPLFPLVAALVAFGILMSGGFTRFGIWKQILAAVCVLIFLKALESAVSGQIINDRSLWPLAYTPAAIGLLVAYLGLRRADRSRRCLPQARPDGEAA
ncbi:MAG: LPS export ABC transporter permease LptF [Pseudomonadota bacterium]